MPPREKLKLTITAISEPDSIFFVPCEPITLHDSQVEAIDETEDSSPTPGETAEALDSLARAGEMMILTDTPPAPRRRRLAS